jgi:hypothetical protein
MTNEIKRNILYVSQVSIKAGRCTNSRIHIALTVKNITYTNDDVVPMDSSRFAKVVSNY